MISPMIDAVDITRLGAQGDGVTPDGIFVPGALPGERARVSVAGHRATVMEITQSAPDRIAPVCTHFGTCGGCALQHASDGLLSGWKRDLVFRALAARGITGIEIAAVHTSAPRSRRRVTFTGRRTKKMVAVGFHAAGSDQIVPVSECDLVDRSIVKALPALAELVREGASRKGELRLSVTTSATGLDVAVTGGKPVEGRLYGQLVAVAAVSDFARLTWGGELIVNRRPPVQPMGRAQVLPPAGGFLQATQDAEAYLVAAMREAVAGASRIADLFAGCGTFALPLAEEADVLAVDSEADALDALYAAWRQAPGLHRLRTAARDLFRRPLLTREMNGLDAMVFDPPRLGARAQMEQIAGTTLTRIGAVSCNPATFARDARILIDAGFRLTWVRPVDQFLWSPHVELAAAFERD